MEPCPFHDLCEGEVDVIDGIQRNPDALLVSCPHCTRNNSYSCRRGQENNTLQVTVCLVSTHHLLQMLSYVRCKLFSCSVTIKQSDGTTPTLTCDEVAYFAVNVTAVHGPYDTARVYWVNMQGNVSKGFATLCSPPCCVVCAVREFGAGRARGRIQRTIEVETETSRR